MGDAREDEDKEGKCLVIECLFHPDTMAKYEEDKLMADLETVLGIDGLSHLGDFMAIIEREKRHQDTRV